LSEANEPLGGREAARRLRGHDVVLSEATATRLLRRLDERGLTEPAGTKGRVLTEEGWRLATSLRTDEKRSEQFATALDVRSLQDAIDVLVARRGVEREAARAAAINASAVHLEDLRQVLLAHEHVLESAEGPRRQGLSFHRLVALASGNKLLVALMDLVLSDELDALEQIIDVVTRSHGTVASSIPEHRALLEAIEARDADRAEAAMVSHLERLIRETSDFAQSAHSQLVAGLLRLAQQGSR